MKYIICLLFFSASIIVKGQEVAPSSIKFYQEAETALTRLLDTDKQKVDNVLNIISNANAKMYLVARNNQTKKVQKLSQLKEIADKRDSEIQSLLTSEQVFKLRAYMTEKTKKK